MSGSILRGLGWLLLGGGLGAAGFALAVGRSAGPPPAAIPGPNAQALAADWEIAKGKLPDQAHAMQDVGSHFANLWFAAEHKNWDLANFYWLETRSHLRWAVRIIPKRKDAAGETIHLDSILEGMENGPLKQLQASIQAKDSSAFDSAYRSTLESCYACHKAADKPYLRPRIPADPESKIINFDPTATWPR